MIQYRDAWERTQAETIRLIALGLDALVDQGAPLEEEQYRVALEEAARRAIGLAPEATSPYPKAVEAVIEAVLDEWRPNRVHLSRLGDRSV